MCGVALKLKRIKNVRVKLSKSQTAALHKLFPTVKKVAKGVGTAAAVVSKPVQIVKGQLVSQKARTDKTEDSGTEAIKLGLHSYGYAERGLKTAKDTVQSSVKTVKNIRRKLQKRTTADSKRHLQKKIKSRVNGKARKLTKKVAKTAKNAAQATKNAAKAAEKAATATAKAVVGAVSKLVSLITSTMPYSLIIIGAILLILILCLAMSEIVGGAGGSVAGDGAWLVDDEKDQTPEEIYEGYKEFIEQAKDVMETNAKDALKDKVTGFCSGDTTEPRKIIQYIAKNNDRTFYPAYGADSTINLLIDAFGTEDYADYMSLLFVLMTREKQQADGVSDGEIYDFDFEKEDFEEFMKTVNENSCRWGDTFVIKTAVELLLWLVRAKIAKEKPYRVVNAAHFSTVSYNFKHRFTTETIDEVFYWILDEINSAVYLSPEAVFVDGTHIKANANIKKVVKKEIPKVVKIYEEQLLAEINEDRENHGKNPFGGPKPPETKTINESTTDPESGVFHKGEHKKCMAYSAQTACDKHGYIMEVTVNAGNVHDSVAFDGLYDLFTKRFPEIHAVVADAGYKTPWICKKVFDDGRIPVLPYKRPMGKDGFFKSRHRRYA